MDKHSDSKPETAAGREIDFSRLVHEYAVARDVETRRDVGAPKARRPAAA